MMLGPAAICRLDDGLLTRIERSERLGAVALSSVATIAIGAGAYGLALGIWRAFEQAAYSAVKLPALLLSIAACTLGLTVMLASVLRSKLSIRQTAVSILLSLAIMSAVLGAMAPVSILVVLAAPPPDPAALGLAIDDPIVARSIAVARTQTLLHVAVVACAGIAGVVRLRGLLARLGLEPIIVRRVLVSFLALQFVAGVELCWLLRPFFGRPHLAPTFSCDHLLAGNFFQELTLALRPAFGDASALVLVLAFAAVALAALVALSLRPPASDADVLLAPSGLAFGERVLPWQAIASVTTLACEVHVTLHPDQTLTGDVIRLVREDEAAANDLASRIDAERTRGGPFR